MTALFKCISKHRQHYWETRSYLCFTSLKYEVIVRHDSLKHWSNTVCIQTTNRYKDN